MQTLINRICSKIERRSINRINWIRTLYFNFRLLPYRQAKQLPFMFMVDLLLIIYVEKLFLNVQ